MANRIRGITIELNGDTTGLDKALKSVNSTIKNTQMQLKDVDKLLKLDPKNTELLAQKQRLLTQEIDATKEKLSTLKDAAKQAFDQLQKGEITQAQFDAIQREVIETEQNLDKLEGELKETNSHWEKWGEAAKKAGKVAKVAAEAVAAAAAMAGAAVVKIVKDATTAYAEYEQLAGGIQKLFGESTDEMMKFAQSAYRTAGISANQYMETATSFSGALLRSLGGDTAEAAKMTDLAITDMADQANTYGTTVESISETYKSLARGNTQTLDNLFGGMFAGTKAGLQDMLTYAEEYRASLGETVSYSTDSYADIISAIHDVSQATGVAGATEKEALGTISGSVNMLKASYQNLLVALVDENGDLEGSINNLITSAQAVIKNILPAVKQALKGIATAIKDLAPEIIKTLPGLVQEILPPLLDAAMELVVAFSEVAPDLILTIAEAITNNLDKLINSAVKIITTLTDGIVNLLPKLIPVALKVIMALVNGLMNNLPALVNAATRLITGLANGLSKNVGPLLSAAVQIIAALVKGLIQSIPSLVSGAGKIVSAIGDLFKPSTAIQWGKDMISGLTTGLSSSGSLSTIASGAAKVASKIASYLHFSVPDEGPLTDYMTWMPDFVAGLTQTLEASEYKLTNAVRGMASDISAEMTMSPNFNVGASLKNIQGLLAKGSVIVLDSGALVGATAPQFNAEFGRMARLEAAR